MNAQVAISPTAPRGVFTEIRNLAQKELGPVWHILYAPAAQNPRAWCYQDLELTKCGAQWTLRVNWSIIKPDLEHLYAELCVPPAARVQVHNSGNTQRIQVTWQEVEQLNLHPAIGVRNES